MGGFKGMIHFSKPYQLHPTPPRNNATVCSPRSLDALLPHQAPTHMWDAVVLSCPPTAGASLSPPLCFSSIQPKQRPRSLSHTMQIVSEDKQERETDRACRGQWNSWLCYSSSFWFSVFLISYSYEAAWHGCVCRLCGCSSLMLILHVVWISTLFTKWMQNCTDGFYGHLGQLNKLKKHQHIITL